MDTTSLTERIGRERRAALMVNACSRHGEALFLHTEAALRARGFTLAASTPVRDPGRLRAAVRKALDTGVPLIVVGGGDGTIACAANELAYQNVALGLLPLGTENSAARTLNIPLDVDGAIDVLEVGAVVEIDLGRIGTRYFLNTVSAGISAESARGTSPRLKRTLGKLAYLITGVSVFLTTPPFHCVLETDEGRIEALVFEVVIANGRHFGDTVLSPEASIRNGRLLVHTIDVESVGLFRQAFRYLLLRKPGLPGTHHFTAARVGIDTDPPQQLDVDGEATVLTPAVVSVAPRALKVMAPRSLSAG